MEAAHPFAACDSIDKFVKVPQFASVKNNDDNKVYHIGLKKNIDNTIGQWRAHIINVQQKLGVAS